MNLVRWRTQQIAGAVDAIFGQTSAHSLATGPVMAEPFISPLALTMTPALSSKYTKMPSMRLQGFFWRMHTAFSTFLRNSGLPFFTVARTISPTEAQGILFK